MKKIIIVYGVLQIIFSFFLLYSLESKPIIKEEEITIISPKQEAYLGTLRFCESRGREEFKILDSNNKYSFAPYMFQMDTFLEQGKLYGILDKDLTAKQAESSRLIYDRKIQEKIAHNMLLDKKEKNWFNCWKTKLNKEPYPIN